MVEVTIIGCGNLGSALITGLWRNGEHNVTAYDIDEQACEAVEPYCQQTTTDLDEAARSGVLVLAVKPDVVGTVLEELDLSPEQTLVTVAAGVSRAFVTERTDATVIRIMPNLAAETGNMAAAVTWDEPDPAVRQLLDDLGEAVEIDEDLMHTATALNGSSPAFVFYLIQALQNAGIEQGLSAKEAETLAAQTFKGAAETVLRSDRSIDELIDAVCSPNGTTIEGMNVLWESDIDGILEDALVAATERSRELAEEREDE